MKLVLLILGLVVCMWLLVTAIQFLILHPGEALNWRYVVSAKRWYEWRAEQGKVKE